MFESIDPEVLTQEYLIPYAIAFVKALLIFVIGRWIAGLIVGAVRRLLGRRLDPMLADFIAAVLKALLLLIVIVAALNQLGIETTSLVALIGAAGLAIGLALQGSLGNFSAGSMIILFRPIAQGEFVEIAGVSGVVERVHMFHTELRSTDNKMIIVPNSEIYDSVITNYSRNSTRRVDMAFGIGYDDDIDRARDVIREVLAADARIHAEPAPQIVIGELGDSAVTFFVRPWVATDDYWPVKFDITEKMKKAFDVAGISIPYPQMDVHLDSVDADAA